MVAQSEYEAATEAYTGWCTTCCAFTRECTEPDAEGYDCPQCEKPTVMGAENALIAGLIEFDSEYGDPDADMGGF
jgi:Zn finger protein HypA/HybF involved in hydrogenase expression